MTPRPEPGQVWLSSIGTKRHVVAVDDVLIGGHWHVIVAYRLTEQGEIHMRDADGTTLQYWTLPEGA